MAHGGYSKRWVNPAGCRSKSALGPEKKPKSVTLKNQIRSIERMLRKNLPAEVREAQEKKLEGFKKQQEIHSRLAVERKIFMRDRKIKFFERRKIERRIRRLEKLQRASSGQAQDAEVSVNLSKLKEDLEYVRFFPKTEKYVSLFTGGEDTYVIDKRNKLRKQIKANIVAAAASGKDLEETGSEDDGLLDMSEDDFFLNGSSSDDADADDEWTDKSTKVSSASGKATSGMSSDERNQRQISARALIPPPRPSSNSRPSSVRAQSRFGPSSSKNSSKSYAEMATSSDTSNSRSGTSFNTSNSITSSGRSGTSFKASGSSNSTAGQSSNLSSNSDAHKPVERGGQRRKSSRDEWKLPGADETLCF